MDAARIEFLRKQAKACGGCPIRLSGAEVLELLRMADRGWHGTAVAEALRGVLGAHREHAEGCKCQECQAWEALEYWDGKAGGTGKPPAEAKKNFAAPAVGDVMRPVSSSALARKIRVTEVTAEYFMADVLEGDNMAEPLKVMKAGWWLYRKVAS